MWQHNIFMANSYNRGKRVALDLVFPDINSKNMDYYQEKLAKFSKKLYNQLGDNPAVTAHTIRTNSQTWKSVVEADSFFDDVLVVKDMSEFVGHIKDGRKLTALDFKLLIYFLLEKNNIKFVDKEDIYRKVFISYRDAYKVDLYDIDNGDKKMPSNDVLEGMSSAIVDKILSSDNGFDKFRYVLSKLHNITKSPLFL